MLDLAALRAFGLEDLMAAPASPNGYAHHLVCFGCGKEFGSNRSEKEGRRAWCATCKAAGKPSAQRARDFRASKSKVQP